MSVQVISDADFRQEIESNDRVAIKFFADWCGACRLISPKFKRLSDDERFANIKFLDVNAEKNPDVRKWAGVTNLPFFAVVQNGEIVAADCVAKEEKVVEMLEKIA